VSSPIIAEPEVYGGIELDEACSFLLLFSDGLYEALEEATGTEHVNRDIASMVAAEFAAQATLSGVAQAVVDKVARNHHDAFIANSEKCQQRDDITLLIRNFNYPMPNAVGNNSNLGTPMSNPAKMQPLSLVIPTTSQQEPPPKLMMFPSGSNTFMGNTSTLTSGQMTFSSSNESSSGEMHMFGGMHRAAAHSGPPQLPLDESGRLPAYVDFTDLNNIINSMSEEELALLELKPAYEPIPEEQEVTTPNEKDSALGIKDSTPNTPDSVSSSKDSAAS
jgi:TAK1-binding protein 1